MTTFRGAEEVYDFAGVLGTSELDDDVAEAITTNVLGAAVQFEAAIRQGVRRVLYASKPNVWLNTYSITEVGGRAVRRPVQPARRDPLLRAPVLQRLRSEPEPLPDPQDHPDVRRPRDAGPALEVFGDGEQVVDLVYSPDLARLTVQFLAEEYTEPSWSAGAAWGSRSTRWPSR